MNKFTSRAFAVAIGLAFSAGATALPMSNAEYKKAQEGIAAAYKTDRAACAPLADAAKATCRTEAKNKRNAARSDLAAHKPASPAPTAATSKKEKAQVYVDDSVITAKVKAAVFEEPSLKSAEINVETSKGRVQLSGFVRSRADIDKAVEVARKVGGVTSVQNVMIVKGQQ